MTNNNNKIDKHLNTIDRPGLFSNHIITCNIVA